MKYIFSEGNVYGVMVRIIELIFFFCNLFSLIFLFYRKLMFQKLMNLLQNVEQKEIM